MKLRATVTHGGSVLKIDWGLLSAVASSSVIHVLRHPYCCSPVSSMPTGGAQYLEETGVQTFQPFASKTLTDLRIMLHLPFTAIKASGWHRASSSKHVR